MLKDDFFSITTLDIGSDVIKATLQLNEKHEIFDGHFPGQPVVPGVCMMQMVKEVVETAVGKKMLLAKAIELKFLIVIDPNQSSILKLQLKYSSEADGTIHVAANLFHDTSVCFKFKGVFQLRENSAQ